MRIVAIVLGLLCVTCSHQQAHTAPRPVHQDRWALNPAALDTDLLCVPVTPWDVPDGQLLRCATFGEIRTYILGRRWAE